MTTDTEVRRRIVLYDLPSKTDAFAGRGHQRTAASVASTIRQFESSTRAIGLEGKWGSGKSTIVEIATAALEAEVGGSDYYVYTFDLWANQTSNFRRSFLEGLLTWIQGINDTKASFVQEMRDKIRNKTVDTTTTNTKLFSGYGLAVLTFLLLLPWLYSWLSPVAFRQSEPTHPMTIASGAVIALMLVATAGAFFLKKAKTKNSESKPSWVDTLSATLSVFSKDAETVHVRQNIREADPSQGEFERTFKEILSEFQTEKQRIIVVFDNIDRLQSENIIDAWSDIRAVLSTGRHGATALESVIAIVPYDRDHILRAMSEGAENDPAKHEDVFRKSFDAIFFVSPPVVSDSFAFFSSKLHEALPGSIDRQAAYRIYKIFNLLQTGVPATPRKVISFINSIAVSWEQWGNLIPLPTISVFHRYQDQIEKNPDFLRNENPIDARYVELADDPELFTNLAALSFNVEPEHALQVLLHNRIEDVFTSEDKKEALTLAAAAGFEVILPEVYEQGAQRWAESSPTQFKCAASNLALLEDSTATGQCKRKILKAASSVKATPPSEWEKMLDLLDLYPICTTVERRGLTQDILGWLFRCVPEKNEEQTAAHGVLWIEFVTELRTIIAELDGEEAAKSDLQYAMFPNGFEFLLGAAGSAGPLRLSDMDNVRGNPALLSKNLASRLVAQPKQFRLAWDQIRYLVDPRQVSDYVELLAQDLSATDYSSDPERFASVLKNFNMLFEECRTDKDVVGYRKSLVSDGTLYHAIQKSAPASSADEIEATGAALWPILDHYLARPLQLANPKHPLFGDVTSAKSFVQDLIEGGPLAPDLLGILVKNLLNSGRLAAWIRSAASAPANTDMMQEVIFKAVETAPNTALDIEDVIKYYEFLRDILGDHMEHIMRFVVPVAKEDEIENVDYLSVPLSLITHAAIRQESAWVDFTENLDHWLTAVQPEAWTEALVSKGQLLDVLVSRVEQSGLTVPPGALRGPLNAYLLAVLAGEQTVAINLDSIVDALPPNNRDRLASDVLEALDTQAPTISGVEAMLDKCPQLLDRLPLASRPETSVRKILIHAIQIGSDAALAYLERNGSSFRECLKSVNKSIVGEVQEYIDGASGDRAKKIRSILDLRDNSKSKKE